MLCVTKQSGFTLLELIAFITVLAVVASLSMPLYNTFRQEAEMSKFGSNSYEANQLALGRMQLIIEQRRAQGFSRITTANLTCTASSPAVCTDASPNGYTISQSVTPNVSINGDNNHSKITVTARLTAAPSQILANLQTIIADY